MEHLTAHSGGGLVTFGGFVTYGRTIGFNLTADGTDIRFRYAGISVTSDQRLRLIGHAAKRHAERRHHGDALCADSVHRPERSPLAAGQPAAAFRIPTRR